MASSDYYEGQRALIEAEFRLLGVPTDPTIIQVISRSPSGSVSVLTYPAVELTRRDTGLFEASVLLGDSGQWHFRVIGEGVVDAVTEINLDVLQSNVV
jgi:hypothetical protein